jgi:hypothetical protein
VYDGLRIQKLGWIYASVERKGRSPDLLCHGILVFGEDGKLLQDWTGPSFRLKNTGGVTEPVQTKEKVFGFIQGDSDEEVRTKYEIDREKIFLVGKDTLQKVGLRSGSIYYEQVRRYLGARKPLAVYFSPFRSGSTGKVRSKHILVIDADAKVVEDWSDPSGWVVGWTEKPLSNTNALRMVKEFLAENGIPMSKRDRAYRLNPQGMKNKLVQFQVSEDIA